MPLVGEAYIQRWWFTEGPRSCLLLWWACGACILEQCDLCVQKLAAGVEKAIVSFDGIVHPWRWTYWGL